MLSAHVYKPRDMEAKPALWCGFSPIEFSAIRELRKIDSNLGDDSTSDANTRDAIEHNRPAFWNLHSYHQSKFIVWSDVANQSTQGLEYIVKHAAEFAVERNYTTASVLRAFLARLVPANEYGANMMRIVFKSIEIMESGE